jgi:hypothetical protein
VIRAQDERRVEYALPVRIARRPAPLQHRSNAQVGHRRLAAHGNGDQQWEDARAGPRHRGGPKLVGGEILSGDDRQQRLEELYRW